MTGESGMVLREYYMTGYICMRSQIGNEQRWTLVVGNFVAWHWHEGRCFFKVGNTSWYWL